MCKQHQIQYYMQCIAIENNFKVMSSKTMISLEGPACCQGNLDFD